MRVFFNYREKEKICCFFKETEYNLRRENASLMR